MLQIKGMTQLTPVLVQSLVAREVLDSRGFPTVEVEMVSVSGNVTRSTRAIVPSGASTGEGEALELRDGDMKRYQGKGVLKAVRNVLETIAPKVVGQTYKTIEHFDRTLLALDPSETKSDLGANAILGASMAFARAFAEGSGMPLYKGLASTFGSTGTTLPVPLMNVFNGGKHADNNLSIQELMIVPHGFTQFKEALRAGSEIFHTLKKILSSEGYVTAVGDEGGFAPKIDGENPHEEILKRLMVAIEKAGYKPGVQVSLALDCAASEFFDKSSGQYEFEGRKVSSEGLVEIYKSWCQKFPIVSIEDGLAEHDWSGWAHLTQELGKKIQLVGDDLFCTNAKVLQKGIDQKVSNSILIKVNQIGSVTETLETMRLAKSAGYTQIISHRSGETEDTFIADLAVGTDCGQIKTGSLSRTDRIAKYNQLLRIEEALGKNARFAGSSAFRLS